MTDRPGREAPPPGTEVCYNCKFYRQGRQRQDAAAEGGLGWSDDTLLGVCRLHPPVVAEGGRWSLWPGCRADDWCSHFLAGAAFSRGGGA